MLLELKVKNLGIIEDINWRLGEGLNVITGETGAGKSLVIDAVESMLAARAEEGIIRHGVDEARIEGVFSLGAQEGLSSLRELLAEKGLAEDGETLVIECGFRRQRPTVVRVNGHAVSKALIRQIGHLLVDIYGQSEHLSLYDRKSHLNYLDSYAQTLNLRSGFGIKAAEFRSAEGELEALEKDEKDHARREEFLSFQIDEINRAQLQEGEEEELERERNILSSTEKLQALSYEAYRALYEEEASHAAPALDKLNEAAQAMKKLVELDPAQQEHLDSLDEAIAGLTDVARSIHAYSGSLEYDPKRLDEIESRLELIRGLKRKYGQTISDVLEYLARAGTEMETVSHSQERRARLEGTVASLKREMGYMAHQLSGERSRAAGKLVTEVKKHLHDLNMPHIEFDVSIGQERAADGIPLHDGETYAFGSDGVDVVEFMVSTNPGEPLKPLARIASTGEISRFTLALKGALSEADNIPVLIFDEIDIGVGGRSGQVIGEKLWALARTHQVVCVTHLPQVAAFADAHFSVHKETSGTRTLSVLEDMVDEARIEELATMLAGPRHTSSSSSSARELAQKAEKWKKLYPNGTAGTPVSRSGPEPGQP